MEHLIVLAEKHFGSRDLNKIFHLKEGASETDGENVWNSIIFSCFNWIVLDWLLLVQHSYKLLSLLVHPDRTSDTEATEKFQVLNQIYKVQMCQEKFRLYEVEKFVLILSDEEYAKSREHYAGYLVFQICRNSEIFRFAFNEWFNWRSQNLRERCWISETHTSNIMVKYGK